MQEDRQQFGSGSLAGVVLFSDFAHNSGPPAARRPSRRRLAWACRSTPSALGATEAIDLAVDLQTDPKMKKAERSNIAVNLRQSGLDGQSATGPCYRPKLSGERPEPALEIKRRSANHRV